MSVRCSEAHDQDGGLALKEHAGTQLKRKTIPVALLLVDTSQRESMLNACLTVSRNPARRTQNNARTPRREIFEENKIFVMYPNVCHGSLSTFIVEGEHTDTTYISSTDTVDHLQIDNLVLHLPL